MTLAEDARDWRVGGRLALGSSFGLGLEGTRRESGTGSPEHGVTLRIEASGERPPAHEAMGHRPSGSAMR